MSLNAPYLYARTNDGPWVELPYGQAVMLQTSQGGFIKANTAKPRKSYSGSDLVADTLADLEERAPRVRRSRTSKTSPAPQVLVERAESDGPELRAVGPVSSPALTAEPLADRGCDAVTATDGRWQDPSSTQPAPFVTSEPLSGRGLHGESKQAVAVRPDRLTPSQVATLQRAESLGILNSDGRANLDAWRTRKLAERRQEALASLNPLARLRRWLAVSVGGTR